MHIHNNHFALKTYKCHLPSSTAGMQACWIAVGRWMDRERSASTRNWPNPRSAKFFSQMGFARTWGAASNLAFVENGTDLVAVEALTKLKVHAFSWTPVDSEKDVPASLSVVLANGVLSSTPRARSCATDDRWRFRRENTLKPSLSMAGQWRFLIQSAMINGY